MRWASEVDASGGWCEQRRRICSWARCRLQQCPDTGAAVVTAASRKRRALGMAPINPTGAAALGTRADSTPASPRARLPGAMISHVRARLRCDLLIPCLQHLAQYDYLMPPPSCMCIQALEEYGKMQINAASAAHVMAAALRAAASATREK